MCVHARGVALGLAVLIIVSLSTSCGKERPSLTGPSTNPPSTTASTPTVTDVVLSGPQTVPPGGTAQFTLTAKMSDGTTQDVTHSSTWGSNNISRATASNGQVTGRALGDATITARYTPPNQTSISRTTAIIVMPDGTFRVLGRVTEPGALALSGATVAVEAGTGAGLTVTTAFDGRFRLYGLAGSTRINAKKSAYRDDVHDVVISANDQSVDFELVPGTPIAPLEGSYTLTVSASASCRDALPPDTRVRTYGATISRNGRDLIVDLNGAAFASSFGSRFYGRTEADGTVTFSLYDYYYYGALVIELIGTNRLSLSGDVTARQAGDVISGSLNGLFDLRTNDNRRTQVGRCSAPDHQFELRRR